MAPISAPPAAALRRFDTVTTASVSEYVAGVEDDPEKLQRGQKQVEAAALAWTKKSLFIAYIAIFLVYFLTALHNMTSTNLLPYVTSSFNKHALLSTVNIVGSIIAAVSKLPVAKTIDIWGRVEGFVMMLSLCVIGLVMMASCNGVAMYAAAQVVYGIGFNGVTYVLEVFMADTTSLQNRAFMFAFGHSPTIVTTFAAPALAELFHDKLNWRWAYGAFAIATPFVSLPIILIFLHTRRKAERLGYLSKERSERTVWQSITHYFVEFDAIGMILLVVSLSLFLLPFDLAEYTQAKWQAPHVLSMLIIGIFCGFVFALWEIYCARTPFIPFRLLMDRTVVGSCLLSGTLFFTYYTWELYFTSYLQVVHGLNIRNAGYISSIFSIGSCFWAIIVGAIIRGTGRYKWLAFFFVPVEIIGMGLMIRFRQPDSPIWLVVLPQVLISFAQGTFFNCEQVAAMASAENHQVAVILALIGLFSSIGGAISQTIAGAVWAKVIPAYIAKGLPYMPKERVMEIFGSLEVQLSAPFGTLERRAIVAAYVAGRRILLYIGMGSLVLCFVWISLWRNLSLKGIDERRRRGTAM